MSLIYMSQSIWVSNASEPIRYTNIIKTHGFPVYENLFSLQLLTEIPKIKRNSNTNSYLNEQIIDNKRLRYHCYSQVPLRVHSIVKRKYTKRSHILE